MRRQQDNHAWHLETTDQDEHPEKDNVSLADALSKDAAVMVIIFGASVAPYAMLAVVLPIKLASYAIYPFLPVVVLLILKQSPCVDEANEQMQYNLGDENVCDYSLDGISNIQVTLDDPINGIVQDGPEGCTDDHEPD